MEEQLSASQIPQQPQGISPEQLEAMKAYAREQAVRMSFQQPPLAPQPLRKAPEPTPEVVYVRRNLTVAEILLICVLSCTIVGGIQTVWGFASKHLPQIEVRVK